MVRNCEDIVTYTSIIMNVHICNRGRYLQMGMMIVILRMMIGLVFLEIKHWIMMIYSYWFSGTPTTEYFPDGTSRYRDWPCFIALNEKYLKKWDFTQCISKTIPFYTIY